NVRPPAYHIVPESCSAHDDLMVIPGWSGSRIRYRRPRGGIFPGRRHAAPGRTMDARNDADRLITASESLVRSVSTLLIRIRPSGVPGRRRKGWRIGAGRAGPSTARAGRLIDQRPRQPLVEGAGQGAARTNRGIRYLARLKFRERR